MNLSNYFYASLIFLIFIQTISSFTQCSSSDDCLSKEYCDDDQKYCFTCPDFCLKCSSQKTCDQCEANFQLNIGGQIACEKTKDMSCLKWHWQHKCQECNTNKGFKEIKVYEDYARYSSNLCDKYSKEYENKFKVLKDMLENENLFDTLQLNIRELSGSDQNSIFVWNLLNNEVLVKSLKNQLKTKEELVASYSITTILDQDDLKSWLTKWQTTLHEFDQDFLVYDGIIRCLTECPDGYFTLGNKCIKCYKDCKTCSGALTHQCTACPGGHALDKGVCTQVGIVQDQDQSCSIISIDDENNCLQCNSKLSFKLEQSYKPSNTIQKAIEETKEESAEEIFKLIKEFVMNQGLQEQFENSLSELIEYNEKSKFVWKIINDFDNLEMLNKIITTKKDIVEKYELQTINSLNAAKSFIENQSNYIFAVQFYYGNVLGICQKECSTNEFAFENECMSCSKYCKTCTNEKKTSCTSCYAGYYLSNGKCLLQADAKEEFKTLNTNETLSQINDVSDINKWVKKIQNAFGSYNNAEYNKVSKYYPSKKNSTSEEQSSDSSDNIKDNQNKEKILMKELIKKLNSFPKENEIKQDNIDDFIDTGIILVNQDSADIDKSDLISLSSQFQLNTFKSLSIKDSNIKQLINFVGRITKVKHDNQLNTTIELNNNLKEVTNTIEYLFLKNKQFTSLSSESINPYQFTLTEEWT